MCRHRGPGAEKSPLRDPPAGCFPSEPLTPRVAKVLGGGPPWAGLETLTWRAIFTLVLGTTHRAPRVVVVVVVFRARAQLLEKSRRRVVSDLRARREVSEQMAA